MAEFKTPINLGALGEGQASVIYSFYPARKPLVRYGTVEEEGNPNSIEIVRIFISGPSILAETFEDINLLDVIADQEFNRIREEALSFAISYENMSRARRQRYNEVI